MGNFIINALESVGKNIVIFVVSIMTIVFLVAADLLALILYPVWAWKNPCEASSSDSLVCILSWKWLIDIVNPGNSRRSNAQLRFFQCIMRGLDAAVVKLWNSWFLHCSPMKKRQFFIDKLGNHLQSLSQKTQEKYFEVVDDERKVYLIKNNMLSPEILPNLYKKGYVTIFIQAGKLTDEQFKDIHWDKMKNFCAKNDLNLQKQYYLIDFAVQNPEYYGPVLRAYIMRKGLHPSAVAYFYKSTQDNNELHAELIAVPKVLQYRQDLVTVLQTVPESDVESFGSHLKLDKLRMYLKERKELGYDAQIALTTAQYEVFHELKLTLQPKAVCIKLSRVNKNDDATRFVEFMMRYGELDNNEEAMLQVAGDEKLNGLWLDHLTDKGTKKTA